MGSEDNGARHRVARSERDALVAERFRVSWYRRAPVVWRAIAECSDLEAWRPEAMRAQWGEAAATLRWFAVDPSAPRMRFTSLCTRLEPTRLAQATIAIEAATHERGECPYLRMTDAQGEIGARLARLDFADHVFARDGTDADDWSVHERVLRMGPRDYVYPLHCDNLETVLMQLHGTKEISFFAPESIAAMRPRDDDATRSAIDDLDAEPMAATRWQCLLEPGDAVYIPALWFHEVRAHGVTVSASCTWRRRDHRAHVEAAKPDAWVEWERANRRVY